MVILFSFFYLMYYFLNIKIKDLSQIDEMVDPIFDVEDIELKNPDELEIFNDNLVLNGLQLELVKI